MRRFWQKKMTLLFALLFLAVEIMPSMTVHAYSVDSPQAKTAGMELVAQSDEAELYLDREAALLCLVDRSSGIAVETKIMDGDSGNANIKANQKSDFIINYYQSSKAVATAMQVNYTMAIEPGQMEYSNIENGIRISYDMKEDKLSIDCVPKYISEERMQSLVLDHLDSEDRKWLEDYYRAFKGKYTRTKDSGVTQSVIRQLYSIFYEKGQYTNDDLQADNEENEYESKWSNLAIKASVEYVLDGKDLLVRVPMDSIEINDEEVIVNSITVLPYFLSATQEEEGYFLVPDGTGAVINFNNGKLNATDYHSRVYGDDPLLELENISDTDYYANMPVIGAVYKDYAMLAIVEEGQALAEINAKIAGKTDNYNNAYFTFYISERSNVATTSSTSVTVNKFTGDAFDDTIVIRYKLLTDAKETSYTGLAHTYRQYLVDQGILSFNEEETALYLEVLGSTLEQKTFLGFPYNGVRGLTSFKETASILEDLSGRGVSNVNVQLDGWLDGGQRHENLSSIKLESAQGSKSSFNSLIETAQNLGYGLYPDVAMQYIHESYDAFQGNSAKKYAKKYASRYLSNEYASLTEIPAPGFTAKFSMMYSPFILSPANLQTYAEKAVKGLSKFDLTGLSVTDLGTELYPDYYQKAPVSRQTATGKVADAIDVLNQQYDVLMKTPYQYAWKGVTKMCDLPVRSTEYTVFDYDVPFLQLVLDGCVSYSTEPLNYQTEKNISELLLKCIETRSNPKFYVMDADMSELHYALYADYLSIKYSDWADRIVELYQEYEIFAGKVAGSKIASHETLAEKLVKVTYENGVVVYVNYNDAEVSAEGKSLAARSYLVVD